MVLCYIIPKLNLNGNKSASIAVNEEIPIYTVTFDLNSGTELVDFLPLSVPHGDRLHRKAIQKSLTKV